MVESCCHVFMKPQNIMLCEMIGGSLQLTQYLMPGPEKCMLIDSSCGFICVACENGVAQHHSPKVSKSLSLSGHHSPPTIPPYSRNCPRPPPHGTTVLINSGGGFLCVAGENCVVWHHSPKVAKCPSFSGHHHLHPYSRSCPRHPTPNTPQC